jgi:hypothetical protein
VIGAVGRCGEGVLGGARHLVSIRVPGAARLPFLFLRRPTAVLGLRALFHGGTLGFDGVGYSVMFRFGFVEGCLRLGDRLVVPLPLLRTGGFFLPPLALPLSFGLFVFLSGLAGLFVVGCAARGFECLRETTRPEYRA